MSEQSLLYVHLEEAVAQTLKISDMSNPKRFFGCLMDIVSVDPAISSASQFSLLSRTGTGEFLSCFRIEDITEKQRALEQAGKAGQALGGDIQRFEADALSMAFVNGVRRFHGLDALAGQPDANTDSMNSPDESTFSGRDHRAQEDWERARQKQEDWKRATQDLAAWARDKQKLEEWKREQQRQEEEKKKEEEKKREKLKKHKRRNMTIGVCIFVVLALCAALPGMQMFQKKQAYQEAVSLMQAGNYEDAMAAFAQLDGYSDSSARITECQNAIAYQAAVTQLDNGNYAAAITAFQALNGYSDSAARITECQNAIAYQAAVALMDSGNYASAITAFEALNGYGDSGSRIVECQNAIAYQTAVALMESGDYASAITAFEALNGYKDSKRRLSECKTAVEVERIMASVPSSDEKDTQYPEYTVTFGNYEQDNITGNGKEPIEWIVLEEDGENALLISKYALDAKAYHEKEADITWENCTLRTWLNETFYNEAFSAEEQERILTTSLMAENNARYGTKAGNDTQDKVFLLSASEAEEYFAAAENRQCSPAKYAVARGVWISTSAKTNGNCWWWLRSPGHAKMYAADVDYDGSVYSSGMRVGYEKGAVRPALWIRRIPG